MKTLNSLNYLSADTTFPNTPESDSRAMVWHTVSGRDDQGRKFTCYVMATDPSDAISRSAMVADSDWELTP